LSHRPHQKLSKITNVNAVYHRSYEIREPIEVRINRESISIVSHPGPDPSISLDDVRDGRMISRRYRNRRIGEFLKELEFTEGRGTGVPKMRRVLRANGSPDPIFYTDEGRLSFWSEIKIHPDFLKDYILFGTDVEAQVRALERLSDTEIEILRICKDKPIGNKEILAKLGYQNLAGNVKKAIRRLRTLQFIAYTIPEKPRSQHQQYVMTEKGKKFLSMKKIGKAK
jgi:ATP-dependent DNA helicase RecG